MKRLTQPLRTSLLALAVLAAIVLDGVLWGPGFGRKAGRFPNGPWTFPPRRFTDWQDRDPEQSLQSLDTQLTQLVQAARGRAGTREPFGPIESGGTNAHPDPDRSGPLPNWASSREVERFRGAARGLEQCGQPGVRTLCAGPAGPAADQSRTGGAGLSRGDDGEEQMPPAYTQEQLDMLDRETELVHTYQRMLGSP